MVFENSQDHQLFKLAVVANLVNFPQNCLFIPCRFLWKCTLKRLDLLVRSLFLYESIYRSLACCRGQFLLSDLDCSPPSFQNIASIFAQNHSLSLLRVSPLFLKISQFFATFSADCQSIMEFESFVPSRQFILFGDLFATKEYQFALFSAVWCQNLKSETVKICKLLLRPP